MNCNFHCDFMCMAFYIIWDMRGNRATRKHNYCYCNALKSILFQTHGPGILFPKHFYYIYGSFLYNVNFFLKKNVLNLTKETSHAHFSQVQNHIFLLFY